MYSPAAPYSRNTYMQPDISPKPMSSGQSTHPQPPKLVMNPSTPARSARPLPSPVLPLQSRPTTLQSVNRAVILPDLPIRNASPQPKKPLPRPPSITLAPAIVALSAAFTNAPSAAETSPNKQHYGINAPSANISPTKETPAAFIPAWQQYRKLGNSSKRAALPEPPSAVPSPSSTFAPPRRALPTPLPPRSATAGPSFAVSSNISAVARSNTLPDVPSQFPSEIRTSSPSNATFERPYAVSPPPALPPRPQLDLQGTTSTINPVSRRLPAVPSSAGRSPTVLQQQRAFEQPGKTPSPQGRTEASPRASSPLNSPQTASPASSPPPQTTSAAHEDVTYQYQSSLPPSIEPPLKMTSINTVQQREESHKPNAVARPQQAEIIPEQRQAYTASLGRSSDMAAMNNTASHRPSVRPPPKLSSYSSAGKQQPLSMAMRLALEEEAASSFLVTRSTHTDDSDEDEDDEDMTASEEEEEEESKQAVLQEFNPATRSPPPIPSFGETRPPSPQSGSSAGPPITITIPVPQINFPGDDAEEFARQEHPKSERQQHSRRPSITFSASARVQMDDTAPIPQFNSQSPSALASNPGGGVTTGSAAALYGAGTSLRCAGCHNPIVGRIVSAMGQRWHPHCFTCMDCGELLEHVSSYEHKGKPYCHLDYHERYAPHCFHCKTSIADERFITLDDPALGGQRYYHELHFFCAECGDPFLDPSKSSAAPRANHQQNHGDMDDVGFTVYKGHPYCEPCHVKLRIPRCGSSLKPGLRLVPGFGCHKPIQEGAVEAIGRRWHPECFTCSSCKRPFEDPSFFQRDERAYCDSCYRVIIKSEM